VFETQSSIMVARAEFMQQAVRTFALRRIKNKRFRYGHYSQETIGLPQRKWHQSARTHFDERLRAVGEKFQPSQTVKSCLTIRFYFAYYGSRI